MKIIEVKLMESVNAYDKAFQNFSNSKIATCAKFLSAPYGKGFVKR